jgi:hypothetical protein
MTATKEEPIALDEVEVLALVARGQELQPELDAIEAELAITEDPDAAFTLLQRARDIPLRIRALELALTNRERLERETNANLA